MQRFLSVYYTYYIYLSYSSCLAFKIYSKEPMNERTREGFDAVYY